MISTPRSLRACRRAERARVSPCLVLAFSSRIDRDAKRVTSRWLPRCVPRVRAQAMPRDNAKGLLWWQWVEMKRGVETHDRDAVEPAWAER